MENKTIREAFEEVKKDDNKNKPKEAHLKDIIGNKRITAIYVFNDIKDAHFIMGLDEEGNKK